MNQEVSEVVELLLELNPDTLTTLRDLLVEIRDNK